MKSAITTINLTKKYKEKVVVDNLNLEVNDGELFALLGVNGAGKTTTIKMLSCILKPASGDALVLGQSIIKSSEEIKKSQNISPQETAIAPNLTVKENLEFIAGIYGQSKEEVRINTNHMVETFGLTDEIHLKAQKLSGGMKRRLSIAMALISNPKILFLDEPTLGLDVLSRRELWNVIKKLKGKVAIVLTTHYLDEVEALSDRVGIMTKGKLSEVGTVSEILAKTNTTTLEDAFVFLSGGYHE